MSRVIHEPLSTREDRRQPGHQDTAASQPNPQLHRQLTLDDSPRPSSPIRDIAITENDAQLLADLRRASSMAIRGRHCFPLPPLRGQKALRKRETASDNSSILWRHRCRLLLDEVPKVQQKHTIKATTAALRDRKNSRSRCVTPTWSAALVVAGVPCTAVRATGSKVLAGPGSPNHATNTPPCAGGRRFGMRGAPRTEHTDAVSTTLRTFTPLCGAAKSVFFGENTAPVIELAGVDG